MAASYEFRVQFVDDVDPFNVLASLKHAEPTVPKKYKFASDAPLYDQIPGLKKLLRAPHKIEDIALVYHRPDDGEQRYLDLDGDMEELSADYNLICDKSSVIIMRTKLSVRVHTMIETLLNATGTQLRQALFALKRIFQNDTDLVLEFVFNQGLSALVQVGQFSDQTYQQYILKALGELVLYVDGMHGLIQCNDIIQWLYELTRSKYRAVVKATLDLLIVFVDYSEGESGQATPNVTGGTGSPSGPGSYAPNDLPSTALLFKDAVEIVAEDHRIKPWSYLMEIIAENSIADPDVQSKALSLINKTLAGITMVEDFYDVVDALEDQKLEQYMDYHQKKKRNHDLLKEFKVYEEMISQVYSVEYEEPEPGTPGGVPRRIRRVKSTTPSLQLSSSSGTPRRSASTHSGPKLSVNDISSILLGDTSSREASPSPSTLSRPERGHRRDNSFDQAKLSSISSKDLADRLAPLASSTPDRQGKRQDRRTSAPNPMSRSSSAGQSTQRHTPAQNSESPLARNSMQDESGVSNGLSGIALCSSRSRAHRNSGSFGKLSRKNSQDKEASSSPKHQRSGVAGQRDSLTEDGSILLDPSSILDEIMAKSFNDKESEEEKSPPPKGLVEEKSPPPRGLVNGAVSPSQPLSAAGKDRAGAGETKKRGEDEEASSSRRRSAAIDASSSPALKSTAKLVSQRAVQETTPDSEVPESAVMVKTLSVERKNELRRSGSINRADDRRSGANWGQISGGKALGMFYHSRRSQYIDDCVEEHPRAARGLSAERDDTQQPTSPLIKTAAAVDQVVSGGQSPVSSGADTDPKSPNEPSAFQQALVKKQAQSRVAQRAKKMYAMMDDEVVIGDPTATRVGQLSRSQLPGGVANDEKAETQAEPTEEALMDEQRPGLEWAYAPTHIPLG
jgi:hypothetical protein